MQMSLAGFDTLQYKDLQFIQERLSIQIYLFIHLFIFSLIYIYIYL